jgi:site-specific DNA recombinase
VLAALRKHLLEPDTIATAIETYRAERHRLSREAAKARASIERDLAEARRKIAWLVREIENGRGSKSVSDRLYELEVQQVALQAQLTLANGADVVTFHPNAADRYRQKVEQVQAALRGGDAAGLEAVALVRELIRRVCVIPTAQGEPVGIEIAGDLAALLNLNKDGPSGMASMVAGVGFEPTTLQVMSCSGVT